MGQGTITGLAQLVAEELECDWKKVTVESITPGRNLARKRVWGDMSTGGSRGIRTSQDYVRRGGATARMMLLQAAADEWKVPVGELTVADGVITPRRLQPPDHLRQGRGGGRRSCTEPDPKSIKLKDPRSWKVAGKPLKRLDTADKLNGSKVYAIDVQLPGHAQRRDQGFPGVRRQGEELRRVEDRRPSWRQEGREGRRHRGRGGCRHLVARQVRARRTADRLGRRRRTPRSSDATIAAHLEGRASTATDDQRRPHRTATRSRRSRTRPRRSKRSTARRSWPMPAWSR